jgi:hypothetical protein
VSSGYRLVHLRSQILSDHRFALQARVQYDLLRLLKKWVNLSVRGRFVFLMVSEIMLNLVHLT